MDDNKKLEPAESLEPDHQLPRKTPLDHQLEKPRNIYGYMAAAGLIVLALGVLVFYLFGKDNMSGTPIYMVIMLSVAAIILIIGIIFAVLVKQGKIKQQEPDYRTFFIIGISWLPLGIALKMPAFTGMGAVFMVIGLINKDKWKDAPKWKDLPQAQKNIKITAIVLLVIMLVLGLVTYYLFS